MEHGKVEIGAESYDGSIPFPRWLLRVAGNQCIDACRWSCAITAN